MINQPKSQKYILNLRYVFLILAISTNITLAQNRTVSIKIDTTSINLPGNALDIVGSYQYSLINLKFIIAGNTPTANVSVKLNIEDYTNVAKPQFNNSPAVSSSFFTTIDKTLFQGVGILDTVVIPVMLKFKKTTNEQGVAYIKINGKPEFAKINFNKPTVVKGIRTITLLDSTTVVQLDTFKTNTASQFPIKLYIKLGKANGKDTSVFVIVNQVGLMNNIKLPDNYRNRIYTLKIANSDWNSKKDTVITKNINLLVQQIAPVTDEQDVTLYLENMDKDTHIVKLMPSKIKNKSVVLQLVESGNAAIESTKVGISHYYTSAINSIDSINIKVKIYGNYDINHNQLAFTFLDSNVSKHFKILENPITITQREWDTVQAEYRIANKIKDTISEKLGILKVPLHIKTINLNDSINNIQYIDLILKGQSQTFRGSQKIKLSVKDKPFWAEMGTNFDLLDNIKTNNFYAGVYMFDKDVALNKKLSFTGGVYESQSVSTSLTPDSTFNYIDGVSTIYNKNGTVHGYQYYSDTGIIKNTTQVKSIGIFFSPQLRLTNTKMDENGLHISFALYAELLWQRVATTLDYSKTNIAATIPLDSTKSIPPNIPYKQQSFALDYRSHYYGLGLPIYIKASGFNLYINTVFGLTNQRFVIIDNSAPLNTGQYAPLVQNINKAYNQILNFAQPKSRWNSFYLIQYRLNEVAYGITFSGEIRGLFLYGSKPVITLALSKKFDLSEVLKPIVAKFN